MALLGIQSLTLGFGGPPLLDGVDLHIEEGDRLCLLGRNGCGKSSLLKVMAGLLEHEGGTVTRQKGITTSYLGQVLPQNVSGKALDIASESDHGRILEAERLLTLFGIVPQREGASLSGGEMRRVLLSRALSADPDLLLLDEPTNHLDIDTILWLEEYLRRRVKTFLFVTHDRSLARHLANRVGEIDRGSLYVFSTSYDEFIRRREELLEAEEKARAEFDKKLAQEEAWLRRGLKARRTRNEGRVRDLMEMREQYRQRREKSGAADMEIHDGGRSGKKVLEAKHITFAYGESPLVKDFSTTVLRGDRVGIVGPNGSGKTTLIKLLLGELSPDEGTLRIGTNVKPVYFDQLRSELDPDKTVLENLGGGAQTIELNGRKKHILGYLQDFLFSPERAKSPVSHLSGGEHNRLLLAKLFARPANLIVLDEPTNDLDIETLELLEDILFEYRGTLLLVSHDREFLDNVVTETFVLDGTGKVIEYAGGYGDWQEQEERRRKEEKAAAGGKSSGGGSAGGIKSVGPSGSASGGESGGKSGGADKGKSVGPSGGADRSKSGGAGRNSRPRKLSYREKQELDALPHTIEKLEEERDRLHDLLADPGLYRSGAAKSGEAKESGTLGLEPSEAVSRLEEIEKELEQAYGRWEFLESIPK